MTCHHGYMTPYYYSRILYDMSKSMVRGTHGSLKQERRHGSVRSSNGRASEDGG
jgi:hypothetical protein